MRARFVFQADGAIPDEPADEAVLAVPGRPAGLRLVLEGEPGDVALDRDRPRSVRLQWSGPRGPLTFDALGGLVGTGRPSPGQITSLVVPSFDQGAGQYRVDIWDEQDGSRLASASIAVRISG